MLISAALHQPFAIVPNASSIPDLDEKLVHHDKVSEEWFRYWDSYYEAQGLDKGNFLREACESRCQRDSTLLMTVVSGLCGAQLFTNSRILHGVRNKQDVARMPEHRRQRLIKARKSAETLIDMCLRGKQYTKNFAFANLYTHLHIAFAARCLIRLTSLVPEGANTRQIGRDVERVAQVLTRVPGFQFAQHLREVLGRARRQKVLPPPSKPASPASRPVALPPMTQTPNIFGETPPGALSSDPGSAPGYSFGVSPTVDAHPFDFSYAEQLFSGDMSLNMVSPDCRQSIAYKQQDNGPSQSNGWNADSWFPFPPLGESTMWFQLRPRRGWSYAANRRAVVAGRCERIRCHVHGQWAVMVVRDLYKGCWCDICVLHCVACIEY